MIENNILGVVLAGGKSQRFGSDKASVKFRDKSLLIKAETIFENLKISNIVCKHADGNLGWPEQIPFDRIIYTAATNKISKSIFNHIKEDGIIVAPMIENSNQVLKKFIKKNNVLKSERLSDVLFVPNISGIKN